MVIESEVKKESGIMHNFNAGPSTLPQSVLEEAAKGVLNFRGTGLSILEIGHRTPLFQSVIEEAISLVKELMHLDSDHEVLFLHGGATVQFMQVPMNLLNENETAAYADTGVWGTKAIKEARLFGNVDVVCSSKEKNYNFIPKGFEIPANSKYFHLTTNNTIYGTQWKEIPNVNMPIIADMSSDIFSKKMDFNSFGLIFAGAQKNMGAAGTNLVVLNKNILGTVKRAIPAIMDYRNHIQSKSMLNTPPVFAIFVSMLTLRWLKQMGGIEAIEKINNEKASLLYSALDNSKLFKPTAAKEDRSNMNICFIIDDPQLEKAFLEFSIENNIYGIKGHRSVGGFRASLYNALPLSSVKYLVDKMEEFEKRNVK